MTDTERAALERRIDELCAELGKSQLNCDMWHDRAEDMRNRLSAAQAENAKLHDEVERLHADQAHWELGNCPSCPNVVSLQEALEQNAKLREFAGQVLYFTTMTDGCGDNCPYSSSDCSHECHLREQGRELGIEVPS